MNVAPESRLGPSPRSSEFPIGVLPSEQRSRRLLSPLGSVRPSISVPAGSGGGAFVLEQFVVSPIDAFVVVVVLAAIALKLL